MTAGWKLEAQEYGAERPDLVKLVLSHKGGRVGVIVMAWDAYKDLILELSSKALGLCTDLLEKNLEANLWTDAKSVCEGDTELAKKRLAALDLNRAKIELHAANLARLLVTQFIEHMPEHT